MAAFRRFVNLFRLRRLSNDIDAELQSHIDLRTEENMARGMTAEKAQREALLRFGNPVTTRERVMAADVQLGLESLVRNVRYALRQLRRSPGFTATAVLALALGIGPNVAIFSIIWATFLAPPPYPNADHLVVVWRHYKGERIPTDGGQYAQFAAQNQSFQSLSFQSWMAVHLTNSDHTADQSAGLPITPGLNTRTVGQPLLMGRDFLPDEGGPGNDHVVILTNWLWRNRYSSDPKILGKSILIDDQPYTIVGVGQAGPHDKGGGIEFNVPIRLAPGEQSRHFGIMIGRLKPGVTLARAQSELSVMLEQYGQQHYGIHGASPFTLTVEHFRNDWLDIKTQRNLWLLLDAVGLVLLIACANIANLLLARGTSRTQELAVRAALGASRKQIFVQLLTESLTLALLGAVIGVGLGWGLMKLAVHYLPNLALESGDTVVQINLPVLCFSLITALFAGVLAGCAPSWRSTRINQSESLKQGSRAMGGRGRSSLQSVLVATEFALALTLLAGAGLALHSFWNLSHIDVGFQADHVITAMIRPHDAGARGGKRVFPAPEESAAQQRLLVDRVRQIPGVADAGLATGMPMDGNSSFPFGVAGQPADRLFRQTANFEAVTPSYFKTLRIRLARGRFIGDEDGIQAPRVVMVNETFVKRYLPSVDPLTQRLLLPNFAANGDGQTVKSPPPQEYQIVGVFHDVLNDQHLTGTMQPAMYAAEWQMAFPSIDIAVRTIGIDAESISTPLQRAVSAVQPGAAIDHVRTMTDVMELDRSSDRAEMILFAAFAIVALLLASIGIFGVMSFSVAQRTHEIGVRMALGARRSEVVKLVLSSGMRMAVVGLGIGLAGALGLGRLMQSTLFGVKMVDAFSLISVAALLFAVALLACWVPARRSAAIDPMQALRNE